MSHSECTHEATKSARARCRRQRNAQSAPAKPEQLSDAELLKLSKLSFAEKNELPESVRAQLYMFLVRRVEQS